MRSAQIKINDDGSFDPGVGRSTSARPPPEVILFGRCPGERLAQAITDAQRGLEVICPRLAGVSVHQVRQFASDVDARGWRVFQSKADVADEMSCAAIVKGNRVGS